jgi:hypothetical protein
VALALVSVALLVAAYELPRKVLSTMRLDFSGPLSRKILAFLVKLSKSGSDKSKRVVERFEKRVSKSVLSDA